MPPTGLGLSGTNILPPRAAIGEHAHGGGTERP